MNIEDDHMDAVGDDIHDAVYLNMDEIDNEINIEEIVRE
jgi:hypothetical protein